MADEKDNQSKNILGTAIELVKASNEKFGESTDRLVDATVASAQFISSPIVGAIEKASEASETLTRSESLQQLKTAVAEKANFEFLGNKIQRMGSFISDTFKGAFGNFSLLPPGMPGLKDIGASLLKLLGLAGLIALLKSDKFASFVESTKEGEGILGSIYDFFTNDFPKAFGKFSTSLEEFKQDPSFTGLIDMFKSGGTIALGIAGIVALLSPFRTLKFLTRTIGGFVRMFGKNGLVGKAILGAGTRLRNALTGTRLNAAGRVITPTGKFAPASARGAKAVAKGALRAIPGVGLAATAIFGVFDGITAGMNEAKKENATKMSIAREATAGVLSGLTFGLISQESISGVMTKTGDFFRSMFAAVPTFDEVKEFSSQAFEATKTFFKNAFDQVPSLEQLKENFSNEGFLSTAGMFFDGVLANVPGYDTVKGFLNDIGVADFASKINDMLPSIDDLMALLPSKEDLLGFVDKITPSFLKDDTAAEKVLKLESKIADKIAKIEKHQAEIDKGDMRTAFGSSREKEISDLQREIAELKSEKSAVGATVIQNNTDASQSVTTNQQGTRVIPIGSPMHPLFAQTQN